MAKEDTASALQTQVDKAETTDAKKKKELPAMAAPTVTLPLEVRKTIATYCRDNDVSFAKESVKMWLAKLVGEKIITKEFADGIDLSVKRGGGVSKAQLQEKDDMIAQLTAQLEAAKKAKGLK